MAPSMNGVTGVLRVVSGALRPARVAVNRVLSGSGVKAALCAAPPALVTVIGPDAASGGTLTVSCDAFAAITAAWAGVPSAPANATRLFAGTGSKNAPVSVTSVPAAPLAGAIASIRAGGGTTFTAAETEAPFRLAVTLVPPTAPAPTGIGTCVCSAAKATDRGAVAMLASALDTESEPAAAGGGERVAVRMPELPVTIVIGSGARPVGVAGMRRPEMLRVKCVRGRPRMTTTS